MTMMMAMMMMTLTMMAAMIIMMTTMIRKWWLVDAAACSLSREGRGQSSKGNKQVAEGKHCTNTNVNTNANTKIAQKKYNYKHIEGE